MTGRNESTEAIYDSASSNWARTEKLLLSDFTARPFVLDRLGPLDGLGVLDLGCGEGFVSRQIKKAGARAVLGIDLSAGMIEEACAQEAREGLGIEYRQADASELDDLPEGAFDRIVAVFLFNYVDSAQMTRIMGRVRRWLAPGGRFVFTVPHPSLPFIREEAPPFFFESAGIGYFTGKDRTLEGSIWRRDGVRVPVRCIHKPFEVYFEALKAAGWQSLPDLRELGVQPEHVELDPDFFGPLEDQPLHLMFSLER
jgi:SAM-dependent methyltransferase